VNNLVKYLSLAIKHKGFSFVEVESICPTYFRGGGKKASPVEMLKLQKKKSISIQKTKGMDKDDLKDRIVTGIFIDEKRNEYINSYDTLTKSVQDTQSPLEGQAIPADHSFENKKSIEKFEIRFAGAGGQGIVLAAVILAEAAGIYEGREIVQTQSYGVESRGGASRAEVIISDEEIVFPEVLSADLLVAMNKQSLEKFSDRLNDKGILIYNSSYIEKKPKKGPPQTYGIPLNDLARKAGRDISSNIVALGAVAGLTDIVSDQSMEKAILKRIPSGTEEINLKAFKLGLAAARNLQ
jgi:2-oxoglutarate ferredoxin oxidoreductase subunit gamma